MVSELIKKILSLFRQIQNFWKKIQSFRTRFFFFSIFKVKIFPELWKNSKAYSKYSKQFRTSETKNSEEQNLFFQDFDIIMELKEEYIKFRV